MLLAVMVSVDGCSAVAVTSTGCVESGGRRFAARTVAVYVPYWEQTPAFVSVNAHLDVIDRVSPMWYSVDGNGNVIPADVDSVYIDRAEVGRLKAAGVQVIPTVTNMTDGEWRSDAIRTVLHDPALRAHHVGRLVELAVDQGYDGIDIDYESLSAAERQAFSAFVGDLAKALHAAGKRLMVSLHPKTAEPGQFDHQQAQDYRAIGAAADEVEIMTYDNHWSTSEPGPIAPTRWVRDVIAWAVTQIPSEKVLLGVALLGYDWPDGGEGVTVTHRQAMMRAGSHGAEIQRDGCSPWFRYTDARGAGHEVWFEDAESVAAKLELVSTFDLGGAFFWRMGGEDPNVWSLMN